jgi:hypothetical protein
VATVDFTRIVALSPEGAWHLLTAFEDHGRHVPLTTVRLIDAGRPGGGGFVARTAIGRLGFDDTNVLDSWQPPRGQEPGICELRKTGKWVRGQARLSVRPVLRESIAATSGSAAANSAVRWQETLRIAGIPGLADPVIRLIATALFGRLVDRLFGPHLIGPD